MKLSVAALFLLVVWQGSGVTLRAASGSEEARASSEAFLRGRAVYEANCAVCHGTGGDGNGMAAHMFRVQPRDFRRGLFKFRSTPSGSLPTDGDLMRTITEGIRWTGMVARPDLPKADRTAVVQYIETFSPRFTGERPSPPVAVPLAPPESPAGGGPSVQRSLPPRTRGVRGQLRCLPRHGRGRERYGGPHVPRPAPGFPARALQVPLHTLGIPADGWGPGADHHRRHPVDRNGRPPRSV